MTLGTSASIRRGKSEKKNQFKSIECKGRGVQVPKREEGGYQKKTIENGSREDVERERNESGEDWRRSTATEHGGKKTCGD